MKYNYHAHTSRCHHASGTPEEYIQRAIDAGITHMGFSDHFPLMFPDGHEAKFRVAVAEAHDYVDELRRLREKYKNKIDIKIGFEMEYYPSLFEDMMKNALDYGAEYLILGQHFINSETEYPKNRHSILERESEVELAEYVTGVVEAIKSGAFTYVAHPDVFNFTGSAEAYKNQMQKICVAAKEYNIPLEINLLGIRTDRQYPREEFWKIVGKVGSPVTFGFDAHRAEDAYDGKSLQKAYSLVEKYKLNYIGAPKLILIQEKFARKNP